MRQQTPPSGARRSGKIVEWNDVKGYGFIDDGKQRVFAHIRDFSERTHSPRPGDVVSFTLGSDRQGRTCAQKIEWATGARHWSPGHFIELAMLLVIPSVAVAQLFHPTVATWIAGWALVVSGITFALYASDKNRAKQSAWRVSEKSLHFWELVGGWPGAFLAQRRLRHKTAKLSFRFTFWLIVLFHHYLAIDALLDWRLFHLARAWVKSLG